MTASKLTPVELRDDPDSYLEFTQLGLDGPDPQVVALAERLGVSLFK